MKTQPYENYPWRIAFFGIGLSLITYALGAFVLSRIGAIASALYLAFCTFVEVLVLRGSCAHCYYYGKTCGFGRGRLCPVLFRRGNPAKFLERAATMRDLLPDLLVTAVPVVTGTFLLVRRFDWFVLAAMLAMLLLASAGNEYVRRSLTCRHCAQRELGCPADKLLNKARA